MMNSRHDSNNTPCLRFVKYFDRQSRKQELTGIDRMETESRTETESINALNA